MSLYAGDRGPKAILFRLATGGNDGTTVDSVRLMVRRPDGVTVEWAVTLGAKTTSLVLATYTLESDGTSVPLPGQYSVRAWSYAVGGALVYDTDEKPAAFVVLPARVTPPT